jgi:dTDP-4-amino-4,6-dideoxygalactose transaminase
MHISAIEGENDGEDSARLTPTGAFLRNYSIDELPSLWNVLKGDMSIVGPRPLLMEYLALYTPTQARRHNVRPGITGLAQVSGRNSLSWEDKFAIDLEYLDKQSLLLDLQILYQTCIHLMKRDGISAPNEATMSRFRGTHPALHDTPERSGSASKWDRQSDRSIETQLPCFESRQEKGRRIFLSPPHLGGKELEYVQQALESNYVAPIGPALSLFEERFKEYTGFAYAVGLTSGTAATHLALRHLGLSSDDEVWCADLTFIGSIAPVIYERARPVFFDCDESSWTLCPDTLEEALSAAARRGKLPRAVIPTDLYGQSCDLDRIMAICSACGVPVIADSAEAMGARYRQRHAGVGATAAVFSFNGNKIITTSNGGVLASNDQDLIENSRKLSQQAREPTVHYEHKEIGYNYRMSNILAAIGVGQLEVLDNRVQRRREIFELYRASLEAVPGLSLMPEARYGDHSRWLTVIRLDRRISGITPEDVRLALERNNIESRPVWKPMHMQPALQDCKMVGGTVSRRLFEEGLCLPSGTAMSDNVVREVADIVASVTLN